MKDWNKIAVLAGLALLFVSLTIFLPSFELFTFLRPLRHGFPWVAFGLIWLFYWCCCGGCRSRCRRRCHHEDSATETRL